MISFLPIVVACVALLVTIRYMLLWQEADQAFQEAVRQRREEIEKLKAALDRMDVAIEKMKKP